MILSKQMNRTNSLIISAADTSLKGIVIAVLNTKNVLNIIAPKMINEFVLFICLLRII